MAQEAKNPQRGMPIGMLGSLGICTVLYILMSSVMTGLVPFKQLNDAAPVAVALEIASATVLAVELGHLGRAVRTDLGDHHHDHPAGAHLADHVARRPAAEVLRRRASEVSHAAHLDADHRRAGGDVCAGLLPIGILGELVSIGTLIAFIVVCLGVLVLRYTRPDLPRPFRVKRRVVHLAHGRGFLRRHGRIAAHRDLVAAGAVERDRDRGLLRLRLSQQPAAPPEEPARAAAPRPPSAEDAQPRSAAGVKRTDGLEQSLVDLRDCRRRCWGRARTRRPSGVPTRPPASWISRVPAAVSQGDEAEFPEAVDAARRHIGEVERGGARPAHAGRGAHDRLEDGEIVIDVRGLHAVGKAGADQRSFEGALGADADLLAVELGAVAARGGEELLAHGIVDHRVLQPPAVLDRDRHREGRKAVQEIRGAVERIDDPDVLALAAAAAFLGEERVVRDELRRIVAMISASALRSMSVTKSLRPLVSIFSESRRDRLRTIRSPARRAARMPILRSGCIRWR